MVFENLTIEGLSFLDSLAQVTGRLGQPESCCVVSDDSVTRAVFGRIVVRFRAGSAVTIRGGSSLESASQQLLSRGQDQEAIRKVLGDPAFLDEGDDEKPPILIWEYCHEGCSLRIMTVDSTIEEFSFEEIDRV